MYPFALTKYARFAFYSYEALCCLCRLESEAPMLETQNQSANPFCRPKAKLRSKQVCTCFRDGCRHPPIGRVDVENKHWNYYVTAALET